MTLLLIEPKKDFHIVVVLPSAHQDLILVDKFGQKSSSTLGSLGRNGSLVNAPSTTG